MFLFLLVVVLPARVMALVAPPGVMLLVLVEPINMVPELAAWMDTAPAPLPPLMVVVEPAALAEPMVTVEVLEPPVTPEPMATVVLFAPELAPMEILWAEALLPMAMEPAPVPASIVTVLAVLPLPPMVMAWVPVAPALPMLMVWAALLLPILMLLALVVPTAT